MVFSNGLPSNHPGSSKARSKPSGLGAAEPMGSGNMQNESSSRSKFLQTKVVNKKWNKKKFSRRSDGVWNHGIGMSLNPQNGAYEPPRLTELWQQNKMKTRRFFPKKRAPRAPRNTTSFIMRAKKSGGLPTPTSYLVSPSTPAILPTPFTSPAVRYREGLVDEVKKEWGVDGYGSMNGLIRLRSGEVHQDDYSGICGSESDGEEETHAQSVQQLEQRIDHDLSRFEIVYPSPSTPVRGSQRLVVRVEELEGQVAHLEDENLALKENLYLIRQELEESRRRLQLQLAGEHASDDDAEVCSGGSAGGSSTELDGIIGSDDGTHHVAGMEMFCGCPREGRDFRGEYLSQLVAVEHRDTLLRHLPCFGICRVNFFVSRICFALELCFLMCTWMEVVHVFVHFPSDRVKTCGRSIWASVVRSSDESMALDLHGIARVARYYRFLHLILSMMQ